jgi:hypothetical protein
LWMSGVLQMLSGADATTADTLSDGESSLRILLQVQISILGLAAIRWIGGSFCLEILLASSCPLLDFLQVIFT